MDRFHSNNTLKIYFKNTQKILNSFWFKFNNILNKFIKILQNWYLLQESAPNLVILTDLISLKQHTQDKFTKYTHSNILLPIIYRKMQISFNPLSVSKKHSKIIIYSFQFTQTTNSIHTH